MADRSNLTQMLRFVCVGVGVAVFFMFLTYTLVSGGAPPFWASVLAYVICFVMAYLLHTFWTFEAKHPHREALPKYLALQVSCAVFSGLVPQVAIDHFGATHLVAAGLAALTASGLSFFGSTLFVFRNARRPGVIWCLEGEAMERLAGDPRLRRPAGPSARVPGDLRQKDPTDDGAGR
jgi:putative flippase GtrA